MITNYGFTGHKAYEIAEKPIASKITLYFIQTMTLTEA